MNIYVYQWLGATHATYTSSHVLLLPLISNSLIQPQATHATHLIREAQLHAPRKGSTQPLCRALIPTALTAPTASNCAAAHSPSAATN